MHASIRAETARCMFTVEGGSRACVRTSSILEPNLTLVVLIRRQRSDKLRRIISGTGLSRIWQYSIIILGKFKTLTLTSCLSCVNRWKHIPSRTRPARPRRCFALLFDIFVKISRLNCLFSSNLQAKLVQLLRAHVGMTLTYHISRCRPVSITQVISGIVIPAEVFRNIKESEVPLHTSFRNIGR